MTATDPCQTFLAALDASVRSGAFVRLILGKPRGAEATLRTLQVRPVLLREEPQLSFLWRHERQDITKNHPPDAGVTELAALIGTQFHSAHLFTSTHTHQLEYSRKGVARLSSRRETHVSPDLAHDRPKERLLPPESQAWLQALGVTTAAGEVKTGMAAKHRQIHKFVEVADMGCGKGYLTFATWDYLNRVAGRPARVHGVEARRELVDVCNRVARETGRPTLDFAEGTIASVAMPSVDVLIALHACDTATDDALARGVASGARLMVVAPCCQKELRPQLRPSPVLAPTLRHGIFQERHAEFLTDALRALLLEWAGYETKVFEFIATEHTAKNIMITATKKDGAGRGDEAAADRVRELAAFYGIRSQALARHLGFGL